MCYVRCDATEHEIQYNFKVILVILMLKQPKYSVCVYFLKELDLQVTVC